MAPDLARVGYPSARHMGKAGAVAVRERVRLNSAGVMRPFLGRLLRALARHVCLSERVNVPAPAAPNEVCGWRAQFVPSLGPLSCQRRFAPGGDKKCWTRGHEGSPMVGKKLYA